MSRISQPVQMYPLLPNVGAPTITPIGTTGATGYTYAVVAVDVNGNKTLAVVGTTATGNATLDGTNLNRITWTDIGGGVTYEIWRTVSAGTPATLGLIGTVASGVQTSDDTGLAAIDAGLESSANTTGDGETKSLQEYNRDIDVSTVGIGVGTYQLQGSYGGSKFGGLWINEGTALTADGVLVVTKKYVRMRFVCTAFTSGAPVAFMAGDTQ